MLQGSVQLYKGDCLEVMKDIKDKSIDMILCDLPYGTTDNNKWDKVINLELLFLQYDRIIKDNGVITLFAQQPFASDLIYSYRKYFRYEIIWEKTKPVGFLNAKKMPLRSHENILFFYKKLPYYNPKLVECNKVVKRPNNSGVYGLQRGKANNHVMTKTGYPRSVTKCSNEFPNRLHPTQKPVELLQMLIETYTDENFVVLDNCMGSGSTGVACVNTNRQFIGIEKDGNYFEIAKKRIEEYGNG